MTVRRGPKHWIQKQFGGFALDLAGAAPKMPALKTATPGETAAEPKGAHVNMRVWIGSARLAAWALGIAVVAAWASPASAQTDLSTAKGDPDFLSFGVGAFDVIAGDDRSAAFSAEYASQQRLWIFHPIVGAMVNSDLGGNAYAGVAVDFFFGNRWVVTPSFAPGVWVRGGSKNLGYPIEFRSSIALAYRFDDRSRLGLDLYHLSNAGLDKHNPGTEVLQLVYSLPLGNR